MRVLKATALAVIFSLVCWGSGWFTPPALAVTQVRLFDISYRECPPEIGEGSVVPGSVMAANCFLITGKAENISGKPVINADVFGRVFDANHDPVMQNRNRIGAIDEIPPGISDFEFRISVAENQPTPLQIEHLKAAGFTGKVRR